MLKVDFYKYASNGNNFILIDEMVDEKIPEAKKAIFSKYIESVASGVGCDSVIFLQKYNEETLSKIYGRMINLDNRRDKPEFIMRVYEKGLESNMCGNGLICLGHHLARQHSIKSAKVATEIPTLSPVIREVASMYGDRISAIMGEATIPSADFLKHPAISSADSMRYCRIDNIPSIANAYITFTGEPHLVIFKQNNSCALINEIFERNSSSINPIIDQIGLQLNRQFDYYPKGINVNFADVVSANTIVNRCFERGINAETYACGTGAVAVAFLANELALISNDNINILPWRARQDDFYKNAVLEISRVNGKYGITTQSVLLSKGEYYFSTMLNDINHIFNFAA